jgi:putative transposase
MVSVRQLCAILGVSRSWYWYYAAQAATADEAAVALRAAIEEMVLAFPGYGYRRVTKALQRDGRTVNHKRV